MSQRVYIYVNGILTMPGDSKNWNRRAVTWTHINTPYKAESCEYFTDVLLRSALQGQRARKLARMIELYDAAGWEIILVGHSNGADVILDALQLHDHGIFPQVILVSAACSADFAKNGLNHLLEEGRIGEVRLWCDGHDLALLPAETEIGRLFGFGALGRTGPNNISDEARSKVWVRWAPLGHSGWWADNEFDNTMKQLTDTGVIP